jgi:two-component sensor histidine kinase
MSTRQLLICFFFLTSFLYFSCTERSRVNEISENHNDSVLIQHEDTANILNILKSVREIRNPAYFDSIRKTGFDMLDKSKQINFTRDIADSYTKLRHYYSQCNKRDSAIYYCGKGIKYYESLHDTFLLAREYYALSHLYSMESRIEEAIDAANKSRYYYECVGDTFMIFKCTFLQYFFQNQLQNSEKKEYYLNEMAELAALSGNKKIEAHFNNIQAGYYVDNAHMKPAMDLYFKNIKLCKELNETRRLAHTYDGIANIYYILKDYIAAIEYFSLSEKIYLEIGNRYYVGRVFNSLGRCYIALEETGKAREYLRKSLKIRREINYDLETAETLHNLALSYYKTEDSLDLALNHLTESLVLNQGIKNNEGIAKDLVLKGKIYYLKKDYNTAIRMAESGLEIAEKYNLPAIIMDGTNLLGSLYAELGRYQKAYRYQTRNRELNDSLIAGDNLKKIAQLEMQGTFDEKQKETELKHLQENLLMEAELERNRLVKNLSIVAGLLFVLLGVFVYINFRRSRRSEKEKEILLKEIHHRVKNNLQIISSLLDLQAGTTEDEIIKNVIKEGQSRVKSMALIHQLLYQTENLTKIDFLKYLEQLMKSLHVSFDRSGKRIHYTIKSENIQLNLDTAIYLGLITNELATNAYKYAFTNQAEGNIDISMEKMTSGEICYKISDNGIGLPEDFDLEKADSLGLKLVKLLSRQMKARLTYNINTGTEFSITLKENQ